MQYVIKSVPTDNKQALEDLLNEMSIEGWDLYTMHEIESENSIDFNCIFFTIMRNDSFIFQRFKKIIVDFTANNTNIVR